MSVVPKMSFVLALEQGGDGSFFCAAKIQELVSHLWNMMLEVHLHEPLLTASARSSAPV